MCSHQEVATATQLLNLPNKGRFIGSILNRTCGCLHRPSQSRFRIWKLRAYSELGRIGIIWNGYIYLHIVRRASTLELGPALHHIFHSTPSMVFYSGLDPYQRLHRLRKAIRHQFKLAVRGDKRDCSIVLKSRQPDTLMKLDVLELY